jgi:hypothetical protein
MSRARCRDGAPARRTSPPAHLLVRILGDRAARLVKQFADRVGEATHHRPTGASADDARGSLSENDRRLVAAWAAGCAERGLPLFEAEVPGDDRPRDAIAGARAFSRGEPEAAGEIRRRFVAGRAARSATSPAARAAAWSAGQAAAVAHMGAHALGAAASAAKAAELATPKRGEAEVRWQVQLMSRSVRAAIRTPPLLEEDSSGPLGSVLLASGALGKTIHVLQAALRNADRTEVSPHPRPSRQVIVHRAGGDRPGPGQDRCLVPGGTSASCSGQSVEMQLDECQKTSS